MFTVGLRAINLAASIYLFKALADSALHPFFFRVASCGVVCVRVEEKDGKRLTLASNGYPG